MKKQELINAIALKTGMTRIEIAQVLETEMEIISDTMAAGENVYLRGFGSFVVKTRAAKMARNIKMKTSVFVPEHNIPAFKPAPDFTQKMNNSKKENIN